MTRHSLGLASVLLVLAMVGAAMVVAGRIPDGVRLPIHWNIDGEPDGFGGKWTALLIPPGITAILTILLYALPLFAAQKEALARSLALYGAAWIAVLIIFTAVDAATIAVALGWAVPVPRVLIGTLGAAFAIIGNALAKSRPNRFIGLRTPWTLKDEEVWIKTHRLGGVVLTLGGIIAFLAAFVPISARAHFLLFLGIILLFAVIPTLYSWLVWRRRHLGSSG
jgi:uncharacterized membrane protein